MLSSMPEFTSGLAGISIITVCEVANSDYAETAVGPTTGVNSARPRHG